jgi:cyclopropane-fatty-acyl-phospholipid synthase
MTHASSFPSTDNGHEASTGVESLPIRLCEGGWVPDALMRAGMRRLCAQRLADERAADPAAREVRFRRYVAEWRAGPRAVATAAANAQHYEVPAEFFELVLGAHLKYSCALWSEGVRGLDAAEEAMLQLTCERAGLADGQRVLELGCGWGSLTLYVARRFPASRVVALSNSASQREWILGRARASGLRNVEVVTADINDFATQERFDRVVSVEMFEHVRNHAELFRRVAGWLKPGGALFAHVFCHRELAYPFQSDGASDWMARHFFSGGVMPSYDLFLHHAEHLRTVDRWWVPGTHYARTSEAWLRKLDAQIARARVVLGAAAPHAPAALLVRRWRMFFMAVAELFAFDAGRQWGVGHYLLRPRPA